VKIETYLADGAGHGVLSATSRDFRWTEYASDFFAHAGLIDRPARTDAVARDWRKYDGEPIEKLRARMPANASKP
jgi:hypothetical protein